MISSRSKISKHKNYSMNELKYDFTILGAGIYGLYFALKIHDKFPHLKIAIIEPDSKPFLRASYVNQARVHNGYHYPRSLATAACSHHYYERFVSDFKFSINNQFKKIYAISKNLSYTTVSNFEQFCNAANIEHTEVSTKSFFNSGLIEATYLTKEYSFDAKKISDFLMSKLENQNSIDFFWGQFGTDYENNKTDIKIKLNSGKTLITNKLINSTYASINQVLKALNEPMFGVKYELTEICLCTPSKELSPYGITVMDGPFFSVMPFGLSGDFSLSSVDHTPHYTSKDDLPTFSCQKLSTSCSHVKLDNCLNCNFRPSSNWDSMNQLLQKYLKKEYNVSFKKSLFTIKTILKGSETTDSRPTLLRTNSYGNVISILSGKINTIYDLDGYINEL